MGTGRADPRYSCPGKCQVGVPAIHRVRRRAVLRRKNNDSHLGRAAILHDELRKRHRCQTEDEVLQPVQLRRCRKPAEWTAQMVTRDQRTGQGVIEQAERWLRCRDRFRGARGEIFQTRNRTVNGRQVLSEFRAQRGARGFVNVQ